LLILTVVREVIIGRWRVYGLWEEA